MNSSQYAIFVYFINANLCTIFSLERVYQTTFIDISTASPLKIFHHQTQLNCAHRCAKTTNKCVFKRYSPDNKEESCNLYNDRKSVRSEESFTVQLEHLKYYACTNLHKPCRFGDCLDDITRSKGFYCKCWKFAKGENCDKFYGGSEAIYPMESCSNLFNIDSTLLNGFYWITHNGSTAHVYCDDSAEYGMLSSEQGRKLYKNGFITTIPKFPESYYISFDLKLTEMLNREPWYSILHFTTGNNIERDGDRNPAVWMTNLNTLHICSTLNGILNRCFNVAITKQKNIWTSIIISHQKRSEKFWFEVYINGNCVDSVENKSPRKFNNMNIFAGDNWYPVQPAIIRNLLVKTY